jgi:hypothetical protein
VEALLAVDEDRLPGRVGDDLKEAFEDVGGRYVGVGEGHVLEVGAVGGAPGAFAPKPPAAKRVARAAAGADDGAQTMAVADLVEVAGVGLAGAHEDVGGDDVEVGEAVVAAADEAGEPEAPLVRIGDAGADAGAGLAHEAGPMRVPRGSPRTTRRRVPGSKRLKTMTGMWCCSHISAAPMSMTRRRLLITSAYVTVS